MSTNATSAARTAADLVPDGKSDRQKLDVAVAIGGTATAGLMDAGADAADDRTGDAKLAVPYPAALERICGFGIANLGRRHAGIDAMLADGPALVRARAARLRLIEIPGAWAQTTPYWRVHPRRNDRLLAPGPALAALYPEVDLAGVCFVGHLAQILARRDPGRLAGVVRGLRAAWVDKMRALLAEAGGRAMLVAAAPAPLVTQAMIAALGPAVADVIAWPADAGRAAQALRDAGRRARVGAAQGGATPGPAPHLTHPSV